MSNVYAFARRNRRLLELLADIRPLIESLSYESAQMCGLKKDILKRIDKELK